MLANRTDDRALAEPQHDIVRPVRRNLLPQRGQGVAEEAVGDPDGIVPAHNENACLRTRH